MASHLGGLATGFCAGFVMAEPVAVARTDSRSRWSAVVALCGAALAIVCAALLPTADDLAGEVDRFSAVETRLLSVFNTSVDKWKAGQLSAEDFAQILERQVLPDWAVQREALQKLRHLSQQQQQFATTLINYIMARAEACSLLIRAARADDAAIVRNANEKQAEADRLAVKIGDLAKQ
jgi:hypothetical protein